MRFWHWKESLTLLLATLLTSALFGGVKSAHALRLSGLEGKHTYYTYSASSQAKMQTQLHGLDVFHLKGESVELSLKSDSNMQALKDSILKRYQAQLVCVEQVGSVTSYYAYTPNFSGGVWVAGKKVNLHIAIKDQACTVGTPLIFGGY